MLDDFKTELKRLGMKRMRKDEQRRQSTALVLDDKDQDEEVEFADALGPRRHPTLLSSGDSPDGRLRSAPLLESGDQRGAPKAAMGRSGVKISKLPGLKSLGFGIKKGKKQDDDVVRNDLEKQDTQSTKVGNGTESESSREVERGREKPSDQMGGGLGPLDFHTKPAGL